MAHVDEKDEIYFLVHEVFFDKDGDAISYSEKGAPIGSNSIDGLKNIVDVIYLAIHAIGSMVPRNRIIWAGGNFPLYFDAKEPKP